MKIWRDLFNGDEIGSDSYPIKVIDDVVYEVEAKMITKSETGEYNIGGNPSADGQAEPDEGVDSTSVTVNNIVDAHRLQNTVFDKKAYMGYIKDYMKKILERLKKENPARADVFQKNIQPFVKKILDNFKEYDFYVGENGLELNGQVILMFYKEDGVIPYFYYFIDGLEEEKV